MWLKIMEHPHLHWGVLTIGVCFCVIALFLTKQKLKFLRINILAQGKVISNKWDDHDDVWIPEIEFLDLNSQKIQFCCVGSGPNKIYEVGDVVSIRYNPEKPDNAYIDKFWRVWFVEFILWVLGLGWCWGALRNL